MCQTRRWNHNLFALSVCDARAQESSQLGLRVWHLKIASQFLVVASPNTAPQSSTIRWNASKQSDPNNFRSFYQMQLFARDRWCCISNLKHLNSCKNEYLTTQLSQYPGSTLFEKHWIVARDTSLCILLCKTRITEKVCTCLFAEFLNPNYQHGQPVYFKHQPETGFVLSPTASSSLQMKVCICIVWPNIETQQITQLCMNCLQSCMYKSMTQNEPFWGLAPRCL